MGIANFILFTVVYMFLRSFDLHNKVFRRDLKNSLLFIFGMVIAIITLSIFTVILYNNHSVELVHSKIELGDSIRNITICLFDYLGVAFFEETLFRCAIFEYAAKKMSKTKAIFLSSVIFSAIHFIHYSHEASWYFAYINAFLIGIILVIIYLNTDSLMWPIGFHFAWNSFQDIVFTSEEFSVYTEVSFKALSDNIETQYMITILLSILLFATLIFLKVKDKYNSGKLSV